MRASTSYRFLKLSFRRSSMKAMMLWKLTTRLLKNPQTFSNILSIMGMKQNSHTTQILNCTVTLKFSIRTLESERMRISSWCVQISNIVTMIFAPAFVSYSRTIFTRPSKSWLRTLGLNLTPSVIVQRFKSRISPQRRLKSHGSVTAVIPDSTLLCAVVGINFNSQTRQRSRWVTSISLQEMIS